jgi:prepilin-type N-terminal cleavage/methylation domain-containing protein
MLHVYGNILSMTKKSSGGFTIIEVIIVLAIATLIMLIVFLAVPALKRSNRNAARKRDAAYLVSQRVQYNSDNSVAMIPASFDCSFPHTTKLFCTYLEDGLAYYQQENITFENSGITAPSSVPTVTDPDQMLTDTFYKCNNTGTGAVVAPTPRYTVVLYAVETASGAGQPLCLDSNVYPHS